MPASMFQPALSTPLENGQRPLTRYPPLTRFARPAGKMKDEATSASGFSVQTSSCTFGGNIPNIQ